MTARRTDIDQLKAAELLHVHHGCMVAIQTSLAMGDEDIAEFVERAERIAAEIYNRLGDDRKNVRMVKHQTA